MPKLTPEHIQTALEAAENLRQGEDVDHLGHYMLALYERNKHLEDVYTHVQHFIHSGQAGREHSMLIRAIERAEKAAHPHEDAPTVFPES
jgi:hypothetical protein